MRCKSSLTTTVKVTPGADVSAILPEKGVLRFERQRGAMAGNPAMSFDEVANLSFFFADGAALHLQRA